MAKDDEGIRNESEGQEVETRGREKRERRERERVGSTVRSVWTAEMGYGQLDDRFDAKGGKEKNSNFNRSQRVFLDRYGFLQSII
jgi:hypothetical protein